MAKIVVTGEGFDPGRPVRLSFLGQQLGKVKADDTGAFRARVRIPSSAQPGEATLSAVEHGGLSADAVFTVRTDWPMFRFALDRTGVNPYENTLSPANVAGLSIKWSTDLGYPLGSAPILVDGVVYEGDVGGTLFALEATSGAALWQINLGNQGVANPVVTGGLVYAGTNANGTLVAVDASSGQIVWEKDLGGGVFDSPAVASGRLYIGSNDGNLYALDAANGTTLWTAAVRPSTSVAYRDGVLYVGTWDQRVFALDATAGSVLWRSPPLVGLIDSTPALSKTLLFVGTTNFAPYRVYGIDVASGSIVWNRTVAGTVTASPAVVDGAVYVADGSGTLSAFGEADGASVWNSRLGGVLAGSPTVANGVLYVDSTTGSLYAIDLAGQELWTYATGGEVISSIAVTDGVAYVGSFDRFLYAFGLGS